MYVSKDPSETHTNGSAFKTPSSNKQGYLCQHKHATSITKVASNIFIVNLFGGAEG